MATEAKGQRVNINGKATDVLYKDAAARNTLNQLTYPGHDQAIMGTDSYVCDVGQKFAPTLVSNTSLTLADGEGVLQGVRFRIPYGSTVTLTIAAGTSGYKRIDLVVARYTKSTGAISFVVIKGTRATSSPATPAYTTGNVIEGATVVDFPLYKITLDGTTVYSVDKLFTQLQTMAELQTAVNKLNTDLNGIGIIYKNYGHRIVTKGKNTFEFPANMSYSNICSVIVELGDYMIPLPNMDPTSGAINNSYAVTVTLKPEGLILTANSDWGYRDVYAVFFVKH